MSKSDREAELEDRVDELEDTVQKMLPSRRDMLAGGAVAGAGLLGFGAGNASASGHNDGDTQWGSNSNRDDYLADHVDANSLNADEGLIGASPTSRDLITNSSTTLTVGTDTATIQEALNQIPLVVRHNFTIDIPDGSYAEDIVVPPFLHGAEDGTAALGTVKISGNKSTPANVEVNSVYVNGGTGVRAIRLEGVEVQADNPHDNESTAIVCYGGSLYLDSVEWANTGNITNGLLCYNSLVRAEGGLDFGANHVSNDAVKTKQSGRYQEQKAAATPAKGNAGNAAYNAGSGTIYIRGNSSTLTGDRAPDTVAQDGHIYDTENNTAIGVNEFHNTSDRDVQIQSHHNNVGAGGKSQLLPAANPPGGIVSVTDVTNGESALFHLVQGSSATKIAGTANFTTTEGNSGTTNVYWDGTNARFELENGTGGGANYGVTRVT